MKTLAAMGIGQCVLPPLRRPRIELLRELGFSGPTDAAILESAFRDAPHLVAACYSAASMWTANAATVSPAADCEDGKLHLTPANLSSTLHRSLEGPSTTRILRAIFSDDEHFVVHSPLPSGVALRDEGAANHTRLCDAFGSPGLELFVYGEASGAPRPRVFPARQTRLASEAIARRHRVAGKQVFFWQQTPEAIDAGVFHNDVISVGNQNVLLCHERAFVAQADCLEALRRSYRELSGRQLHVLEFNEAELSLDEAVKSYLFNSQLITRPDGKMSLICPSEAREVEAAYHCVQRILGEDNPVDNVSFLDLRQSMNNGGGPACLRLRVLLSEAQERALHPGVVFTNELSSKLKHWIETHYRERIDPDDLRDPSLLEESLRALEDLAPILDLPVNLLIDG